MTALFVDISFQAFRRRELVILCEVVENIFNAKPLWSVLYSVKVGIPESKF